MSKSTERATHTTPASGAADVMTHYVGDDCPGGHHDDAAAGPPKVVVVFDKSAANGLLNWKVESKDDLAPFPANLVRESASLAYAEARYQAGHAQGMKDAGVFVDAPPPADGGAGPPKRGHCPRCGDYARLTYADDSEGYCSPHCRTMGPAMERRNGTAKVVGWVRMGCEGMAVNFATNPYNRTNSKRPIVLESDALAYAEARYDAGRSDEAALRIDAASLMQAVQTFKSQAAQGGDATSKSNESKENSTQPALDDAPTASAVGAAGPPKPVAYWVKGDDELTAMAVRRTLWSGADDAGLGEAVVLIKAYAAECAEKACKVAEDLCGLTGLSRRELAHAIPEAIRRACSGEEVPE